MKASTDDCKKFLAERASAHGLPEGGSWKRLSRKAGEGGAIAREFEHESGARAVVVEDPKLGAAGLSVSKAQAAPELPDFESLGEAEKAAWRWRDAMRVLGGKPARVAPDPGPGWTWKSYEAAMEDYSGQEVDPPSGAGPRDTLRNMATEMPARWLERAVEEPGARAVVAQGTSWCFESDVDWLDSQGEWDFEGARIHVWATDMGARDMEDLSSYGYAMKWDSDYENVFAVGKAGATGAQAMALAWEQMRAEGLAFDPKAQKEHEQGSGFDEERPLSKKIHAVIPELAALAERAKIDKAAGAAAPAAKKPRGL